SPHHDWRSENVSSPTPLCLAERVGPHGEACWLATAEPFCWLARRALCCCKRHAHFHLHEAELTEAGLDPEDTNSATVTMRCAQACWPARSPTRYDAAASWRRPSCRWLRLICWTWRCSFDTRPVPASLAGGAGARPDHSITGSRLRQ